MSKVIVIKIFLLNIFFIFLAGCSGMYNSERVYNNSYRVDNDYLEKQSKMKIVYAKVDTTSDFKIAEENAKNTFEELDIVESQTSLQGKSVSSKDRFSNLLKIYKRENER